MNEPATGQISANLKEALAPFLRMARACKHLPPREPIGSCAADGALIYLDAQDFQKLARAIDSEGSR